MGRNPKSGSIIGGAPQTSPDDFVKVIRARLSEAVDLAYRDGQRAFFQHEVNTWGVRAEALKRIASDSWKEVKPLPPNARNRLCQLLWMSGKIEEGILVVYLYERLRKTCGEAEFKLFERWIDRYVDNWATCDAVATRLIAASIENEPELVDRLLPWTESRNRWKRRAAAVGLVWEARRGRCLAPILAIADKLMEDPDDMVRKGIGWLLKDAFSAMPGAIASFWETHARRAPALVLRIASEKMPEAQRLHYRALRNRS